MRDLRQQRDQEMEEMQSHHQGDTSRLGNAPPLSGHQRLATPTRMLALALEAKVWGRR